MAGNVLLVGDTLRMPELRHEVPLGIPDAFVYAELDGRRVVVCSSMEAMRVEALGAGLDVRPTEEFGADEIRRSGVDLHEAERELTARIVQGLGIGAASVPRNFPVGIADVLRERGVELVVDQRFFDDRRRVKSPRELEGIRRAERAAEAGISTARDILAAAEPANGGLAIDGEAVTCELLKERIQTTFLALGALAEEMIVSHGSQTAVGHDMGSGAIARDDVLILDLFPIDLESACYADITRTLVVGDAPGEILGVARAVQGSACARGSGSQGRGRRRRDPPHRFALLRRSPLSDTVDEGGGRGAPRRLLPRPRPRRGSRGP